MSAFVILVGCSLLIAVVFLLAFFYQVDDGQYDDVYTPSIRVLFDDELKTFSKEKIKPSKDQSIKEHAND